MKIICVGWNYVDHNKEMSHVELPPNPVVFMKPDSAVLTNGKPFFLPDFSNRIEYETEVIVRINRLGKNIEERFAHRYYNEVSLGIDFTARDLQRDIVKKGGSWEIAKAFDGSAVMGEFMPLEQFGEIQQLNLRLDINGTTVQQGFTGDMIFPVNRIIAYVSQFFTLKIGDVIYTGTPAGVGPVAINDHLEGYIGDTKMLDFYVK
ncbi:MAG: fumarylacetoacetate hydrolase family protein [Bacteroidales bacterium]